MEETSKRRCHIQTGIRIVMMADWLCRSVTVAAFRHFEEKSVELEELKRELQGQVEELEEENNHLKRQQLMESEARSKLRQETSRLATENMVRQSDSTCVK